MAGSSFGTIFRLTTWGDRGRSFELEWREESSCNP